MQMRIGFFVIALVASCFAQRPLVGWYARSLGGSSSSVIDSTYVDSSIHDSLTAGTGFWSAMNIQSAVLLPLNTYANPNTYVSISGGYPGGQIEISADNYISVDAPNGINIDSGKLNADTIEFNVWLNPSNPNSYEKWIDAGSGNWYLNINSIVQPTWNGSNLLVAADLSGYINTAPGTAGNVLTSNGSSWASSAPAASGATIKYVSIGDANCSGLDSNTWTIDFTTTLTANRTCTMMQRTTVHHPIDIIGPDSFGGFKLIIAMFSGDSLRVTNGAYAITDTLSNDKSYTRLLPHLTTKWVAQ